MDIIRPIAQLLERLGLHPNTVSLIGFALSAVAGALLAAGYLMWGGILLWIASSVDALDGALARLSGSNSRFGAFLDSTLDRVSEGALLFGLLVWSVAQSRPLDAYLIFVVLLGSVMVSYTRARAEGVGYQCKVGLLTRFERVLILGLGMILGWVRPTLLVMAAFTWITVFQRILYVYRESKREP